MWTQKCKTEILHDVQMLYGFVSKYILQSGQMARLGKLMADWKTSVPSFGLSYLGRVDFENAASHSYITHSHSLVAVLLPFVKSQKWLEEQIMCRVRARFQLMSS